MNKDNAFVKHSLEYHSTKAVEDVKFKLTLVDTFEKPMEREVCEGVMIRRGEAEVDLVLNSKLDHYAPVVGRMVMSNSVREGRRGGEVRRGVAGRGRRRGRGGRGGVSARVGAQRQRRSQGT